MKAGVLVPGEAEQAQLGGRVHTARGGGHTCTCCGARTLGSAFANKVCSLYLGGHRPDETSESAGLSLGKPRARPKAPLRHVASASWSQPGSVSLRTRDQLSLRTNAQYAT